MGKELLKLTFQLVDLLLKFGFMAIIMALGLLIIDLSIYIPILNETSFIGKFGCSLGVILIIRMLVKAKNNLDNVKIIEYKK